MTDAELMATLRESVDKQPKPTPESIAAFLWFCIAHAYEDRPGNPERIVQLVRCTRLVYTEIYDIRDRRKKERKRS